VIVPMETILVTDENMEFLDDVESVLCDGTNVKNAVTD